MTYTPFGEQARLRTWRGELRSLDKDQHYEFPRKVFVLCLMLLWSFAAVAQVAPPVLNTVYKDDTEITGSCVPGGTVTVVIIAAEEPIKLPEKRCVDNKFIVPLGGVTLKEGYRVSAIQKVAGAVSKHESITSVRDPIDEREDLGISAYLGLAIDTFSAEEIRRYLNPEANAQILERGIFGFDFEYRLLGRGKRKQLWLYGETLHGVRSEDVDCGANPEFPTCKKAIAEFAGDVPQNALYMLRNATSLEAFMGLRYELFRLNLPGKHPGAFYVTGQGGFINVAGTEGDVKDLHHAGMGLTIVGGRAVHSHIEVGYGRSDLFEVNRRRRVKIDGYLQYRLTKSQEFPVSVFAQIYSDVDLGPGADAIQSYFGLTFDIDNLFGNGR